MNFWRDAQQQLARSRLIGMYALILAVGKVVLDCELKLSPQLVNRDAMKADDGPNAENAARKNIVALVIIDASGSTRSHHARLVSRT